MTAIDVTLVAIGDPMQFDVLLHDETGQTRHLVTLSRADCKKHSEGHDAEHVIDAAFRFLLAREPKEAILTRFDFSVISQYFPEFESVFESYLLQV